MKVRTQTNLVRRGSVYQFRKKVPADLRDHYPQESIRESLKDFPELSDAKREAARRAEKYEAEFATIRKAREPRPLVPLTPELVPTLAKALQGHILAADEERRIEGMDEDTFAFHEATTEAATAEVRRAYARGDTAPVRMAMEDWLYTLGIQADSESPQAKTLGREFLKARLMALEGQQARDRGELVETPEAPTIRELAVALSPASATPSKSAPKASKGPSLDDVVDYWKTTGNKSPRTTGAAETLAREFKALHGVVPLGDIEKRHFVELRDKMLERVKPATVQSRFNLLKAAFTACLEDDQLGIKSNPMQYVKIRNVEAEEKSRDAFTVDQLQTLFASPVFTKGERPIGGRGETAYWAPLLALFTGARREELLALRPDGVYEWEGVPVIHLRHRPELGQNLKGKAKNNRRIPIHPELIRLGFLDYVKAVQGKAWLFPDIDRSEKARSHSGAWGAWFGRYLDQCGITSKALTFHSFRHTFKHFARASGIPEDHHDAMTGHTSAEVARRYGSAEGYPVEALAESMGRLKVTAGGRVLDLSGVTGRG